MNIATAFTKRCLQLIALALVLGSATSLQAQTFSVSPNSEDSVVIVNAILGSTTQHAFVIENNTALPTTVYASVVAGVGSGFTLPGLGMVTVGAYDTARLYLNFLPLTTAARSAIIHFFNGIDSVSVELMGTVERTFEVSPNSSGGGSVALSANIGARDTQAFVISNNSSIGLTVNASLSGSGASSFSLSTPSTSVSVGNSNTIRVYYAPADSGPDSATLRLLSGLDTAYIKLVGNTAASFGSFTVTPIPISGVPVTLSATVGETASQSFTVVNTTASPITIQSDLSGSGSGSFSLGSDSVTLGAMATGSVTLNFNPTVAGTRNAVLTLANGADGAVIQIRGIATAAPQVVILTSSRVLVEFNNTLQGVQECQTIYITNPTDAAITVTEMTLVGVSGGGNQFTLQNEGGGDVQIAAGGTDTVTVCYTAAQVGEYVTANLRLRYHGQDTSLRGTTMVRLEGNAQAETDPLNLNLVDNLNFDALPGETECQTLRVANPSALLGGMLRLSLGNPNAGFEITSGDTLSLGPLEVGTITICYTGDSINRNSSTNLNIYASTLIGDVFLGSFNVSLNGETELEIDEDITDTVINGSCFRIRPLGGVFGPIVLGGSTTEQILIENRTNAAMTITAANVTGGQATNSFTFATSFPLTIAAFSSATVDVTFMPADSTMVSYDATATLTVEGTACTDITIDLHGVGLPTVTAGLGVIDTLNLINNNDSPGGSTIVIGGQCEAGTQTFSLRNDLLIPLTIGNLAFSGTSSTNFTVVGSTPVLPAILLPGEILTVQVRFQCGDTIGFYESDLVISTVGGLLPIVIRVQTVQEPEASVERVESGVTISVSPNPTRGIVRIEATDAVTGRIEIMNLLGQVVASNEGTSFVWNSHASGTGVSAGVYIVRVAGTNAKGQEFIETRQIVVE